MVVFVVIGVVAAVKTSNEGSAIQQVSWRRPRAIDFQGRAGQPERRRGGDSAVWNRRHRPRIRLSAIDHLTYKLHRSGPPGAWDMHHGGHSDRAGAAAKDRRASTDDSTPGNRVVC